MPNVWEYILLKLENRKTLTKKAQFFFSSIEGINISNVLSKKPKFKLVTGCFSTPITA